MIAKKITYNVIVNGVAKVISIALALVAIGMLTRYLGTDGFGKYTTMLAFFAFFGAIGDFGLYTIATREISREGADESHILSRIFTLRTIISILITTAVGIGVWLLPYARDVQISILIAAIAFIFSSSYGLLNGLFQKHIAMDRVALAELSGKLLQVGVIMYAITAQLSFIFVALSLLVTTLWSFILVFWMARRWVRLTPTIDVPFWRSFLKESAPLGITAIVTFLYFKCDTILLSFLQNQHDVGIYGAAYKIVETIVFFPAMVIGLVFPLMSRYVFTDTKMFNIIANTILKIFLIILVPLAISLMTFADPIIRIVGGTEFAASAPVLRILSFTLVFIFFGQLFTSIAIVASQQKKLMYIQCVAAAGNILANITFITLFSYTGAAYTSVATEFFVAAAALILVRATTPFLFASLRIGSIALAGAIMLALIFLSPFALVPTTVAAVTAYVVALFAFRVITHNDIMQLVSR